MSCWLEIALYAIKLAAEHENCIHFIMYLVSQKNFDCLIRRKLKTTVFTQYVFIFSKLSCSNLHFGIKQSKITTES